MTDGRTRSPRFMVPAEIGLVAVTIATVFGFSRVFAGDAFFLPMVVVAAYTHAVCLASRRRGFTVPISAVISIPGFAILLSWLFFLSTTTAGIPTGGTLTAAQNALNESWESFGSIVAPAPPLPGFIMASCAALFFAVFLADWAAFRLWSAFESIVPATTLFVFCSLLGSTDHRIDTTAVFLAAVLGFLLVHRIARQESTAGWLTADIDRGSQAGLRAGAALIAVALVLGIVFGTHLPGANTPALLSWRGTDAGGGGSRITISPLVDIKDRLITQSTVEVFTVKSNRRAYWRMTSLDTFQDDIWRSGGKYTSVDGDLDAAFPTSASTVEADQTFDITNLNVLWVPAAFEPKHVESPDVEVRYQADSATLIVTSERNDSDAMRYSVRSALPQFTPEALKGASTNIPADIGNRYLPLPDDFSATARQIAATETAAGSSSYEKARLLQDYFQANYTYNLAVEKGHGESAMDGFLDRKEGYCEQFAGTFAAMARSLNIPARVAVGFTPGDPDPSNPNLYHVRGEHAHAWPEVYLGEYGWVMFEPTPTRGAPNAEAWTGRAEQQQNSGPVVTPPTVTQPSIVEPTPTSDPAVQPSTTVVVAPTTVPVAAEPVDDPWTDRWTWRFLLVGLALASSAGMYVLVVTGIKDSRHRRRRSLAGDPSARVRVAWDESVEALELLGTQPHPSETHEEFADRVWADLDAQGPRFVELAHDVDAASYAPEVLTEDIAARAESTSRALVDTVEAKVSGQQRWRHRLDVRPILPNRRPSTRRRASSRDQ